MSDHSSTLASPAEVNLLTFAIRGVKGGTGKTTVTINTAIGFACAGYSVALIDADTTQSSYKVLQRRLEHEPDLPRVDIFSVATPNDLDLLMRKLKSSHEIIIFDTSGSYSAVGDASLLYCRFGIYPFQYSILDIDTAPAMNDRIGEIKREFMPNFKAFAMINRLSTHAKRGANNQRDMIQGFKQFTHLPILESTFSNRCIYTDSLNEFKSVLEYNEADAKKAAKEVMAFLKELLALNVALNTEDLAAETAALAETVE